MIAIRTVRQLEANLKGFSGGSSVSVAVKRLGADNGSAMPGMVVDLVRDENMPGGLILVVEVE
jgi:hypothetical protein